MKKGIVIIFCTDDKQNFGVKGRGERKMGWGERERKRWQGRAGSGGGESLLNFESFSQI